MRGITHALMGAAAWTWATHNDVNHPLIHVTGAVVAAGAALLPDLDHERSTASQSLGPITYLVHKVVHAITGGHRRFTHSLAGCLALGTLAQWAVDHRTTSTAAMITLVVMMVILLAAVTRLARIPGWIDEMLAAAAGAVLVIWPGMDLHMIPVAILIGMIAHALGDALTKQGVPFFWPLSKAKLVLAQVRTGGRLERWFITPAAAVAIVAPWVA